MSPTKMTTKVKLPPNPFIHEILELVGKQRSKAKKIDILKEYEMMLLRQSLFGTLMIQLSLLFQKVKFHLRRMKFP